MWGMSHTKAHVIEMMLLMLFGAVRIHGLILSNLLKKTSITVLI
jgi:hypothetical protein